MFTVLLVEDEYLERMAIRQMIEVYRPHYRIVGEAENGQEAIDMALKYKPNLILMDIQMPILSGIDAAKEIREKIQTNIIFLTAHNEFEYARAGIRLQVSDYLLKPIRQKKLLRALDQVALKKQKPISSDQFSYLTDLMKQANMVAIHNMLSSKLDSLDMEGMWDFRSQLEEDLLGLIKEVDREGERGWARSVAEIKKIASMGIWIYSLLWLLGQMGSFFYEERKSSEGGSLDLSLQYIDLHLRDKLNLGILSKELGFSNAYYSRLFKEEQNRTLTDYIKMRRIFYSEILLKHTDLTINEVAEDCGFNEANYFSRVFKERRGLSPTDFRGEKV